MKGTKLTVGNKLELELYNINGERIRPSLVSQFEAYLPDGTMEILAPIHEGRVYPVHRDTKLDVIYEIDGELYKFTALALERKVTDNIFLLKVKPITDEERVQRRTFFRFECLLDVEYRLFEDRNCPKEDRGEYKKAITKNISGGGLCLLTREKPVYEWYIEGIIHLPRKVQFVGKIMRVINVRDRGIYHYETGIEFVEITNAERERVISFIFDSQRKLLKKGWLTK